MSESAQTILNSFERLKSDVTRALYTHLGDVTELQRHESACRTLLSRVDEVTLHCTSCFKPDYVFLSSTWPGLVKTIAFIQTL